MFERCRVLFVVPILFLVGFLGALGALASGGQAPGEFEIAEIYVEQNATDGDTEIVVNAKPDTDQGLIRFVVRAPHGVRVLDVAASRRAGGLREFSFETPEPEGGTILDAYPEGEYGLSGTAEDGQRFYGSAVLSHALPAPAMILFPAADQVVPADALTIQWAPGSGVARYILEFENESADPEQTLTIDLPAGATSFEVPASLLAPGASLQVGVGAVGENGNTVFVEVEFSTEE